MRKLLHISIYLTVLIFLTGCIKELKQVRMNEIELIQRNYPQEQVANDLSFAYAEPELMVITDLSDELMSGLRERIKYSGYRIACHLNSELDKIILAKGFTISDRYKSIRYMTFSEKRNTTALFYPEIKIRISEKSEISNRGPSNFNTAGTLEIDADVNIVMREPMSNEIIWIKSIPVEEIIDSFQYDNAFWAGAYGERMILNSQFFRVGRGQKHHVPENLTEIAQKIDGFFEEIDKKIVDATLRFVEAEEFTFLNTDIKKLKKLNRY